jgi:hypothetical protein
MYPAQRASRQRSGRRRLGSALAGFSSGIAGLSDANSAFNRNRTDASRHRPASIAAITTSQWAAISASSSTTTSISRIRAAVSLYRRGNGAPGASAQCASQRLRLADFLIGVPDTSSIAFGNADKYFRQPVYDAYATDDWRVHPVLTINAGMRWEYGAPMTELHGRLVNLDLTPDFTAAAPVLGSDPVGPLTGTHYPKSLVRPDRLGIEPRIGISWRPIPARPLWSAPATASITTPPSTSRFRATTRAAGAALHQPEHPEQRRLPAHSRQRLYAMLIGQR